MNLQKISSFLFFWIIFSRHIHWVIGESKSKGPKNLQYIKSIWPRDYENDWISSVVHSIFNDNFTYYSVTIWHQHSSKSTKEVVASVSREISRFIPNLLIDVQQLASKKNQPGILQHPTIKRPRRSLNIVIIERQNSDQATVNDIAYILGKGIFSSGQTASLFPKTLVIIVGKGKLPDPLQAGLKTSFQSAYRARFVDLTILYVQKTPTQKPVFIRYGLFDKKFISRSLDANEVIFPDQMKDLNGSDFTYFYQNNHHRKLDAARIDNIVAGQDPRQAAYGKQFFCKVHNCRIRLVQRRSMLRDFVILPFGATLTAVSLWTKFPFATFMRPINVVFTIPHHDPEKTYSYLKLDNILGFSAIMTLIMVGVKYYMKVFKLSQWSTMQILYCLLGAPLRGMRRLKPKIFYVALIILSFFINNWLVDYATEYELEEIRETVDDMDDLMKLGLIIYSTTPRKQFHKFCPEYYGKIYVQTEAGNFSCLKDLLLNNDRICLEEEDHIRFFEQALTAQYPDRKGFRLANFPHVSTWDVYVFGAATPYYEKFNDLILRTSEVGFVKHKFRDIKRELVDYDVLPKDETGFYHSLLLVTAVLYFAAAIVLLGEICLHKKDETDGSQQQTWKGAAGERMKKLRGSRRVNL